MNKPQQPIKLTETVNKLLINNDSPSSLTIEQCASALAMSMTSFRRKLAQEESSYKLIQSKFLNELCIQALLTKSVKIDHLAIKLGYSERATFERAFRKKFGISPAQFRELSLIGNDKSSRQNVISIAQKLPPMPDSCQQLLREKEHESLNIARVVSIIDKDPILVGRIMGLANKAIYGKTPKNVRDAISRNLGLTTAINLAISYAVTDALQNQVSQIIIRQYTQAFLLAPKLFNLMRRSTLKALTKDVALTEQVLVFALLGIFLLSHKQSGKHELMLYSLQGISDLRLLNLHIQESMGISIFSASALMLSLWHIDAEVIKKLTQINRVSQGKSKGNEEEELLLFMLSCLYVSAREEQDCSELEQKALLLKIDNFDEIKTLLFR